MPHGRFRLRVMGKGPCCCFATHGENIWFHLDGTRYRKNSNRKHNVRRQIEHSIEGRATADRQETRLSIKLFLSTARRCKDAYIVVGSR